MSQAQMNSEIDETELNIKTELLKVALDAIGIRNRSERRAACLKTFKDAEDPAPERNLWRQCVPLKKFSLFGVSFLSLIVYVDDREAIQLLVNCYFMCPPLLNGF